MAESLVRNKVPDTTVRRFVFGAALVPAADLRAWLEAQRDGRRLRLPVVLVRGPIGFLLSAARLGAGPDALTIRCSDSALGVGLDDRARHAAGDAPSCALWLEGFWRAGGVFAVVKAGAPIAADALADAAAEIEA